MGMYDYITVKCKNPSCKEKIEFQSKAGDCDLNEYNIQSVPLEVAKSIDGKSETCLKCGEITTISLAIHIPDRVPMMVR